MRLRKPFFLQKRRHYSSIPGKRLPVLDGFEKTLIRVMMLSVVALSLFQIISSTNPVSFYLKMAGEIDTPAFYDIQDINTSGDQDKKTVTVSFTVNPESSVLVKENENVLGIIKKELKLHIVPGTVQLDARHIHQPVTVEMVVNEKKYSFSLNGDVKTFNVQ
ncbi:MAG: hypothetical protein AWM53_01977 [Candidatus Dichloromethanomonas elyunquensis]|nr:MAG: hypothetical protein AWM53_01977 [Candidatus Dichloromethanomonas elyunquensis]